MTPSSAGWPTDPRLGEVLRRAIDVVRALDPLAMAALGEGVGPPPMDRARESENIAVLRRLALEADALGPLPTKADELDRAALRWALGRAADGALMDRPVGGRVMERHLLFCLSQVALDVPQAIDRLGDLVAAGPAMLAQSRVGAGAGSVAAGHLELEAVRRLPALLDACAGAVAEPGAAEVRFGVEAALGRLLEAAAESAGWLLKEYLPTAPVPAVALVDPGRSGLGFTLEELEREAEDALATAVSDLAQAAAHLASDDARAATPAQVRLAWEAAAATSGARYGLPVSTSVDVRDAPGWLRPLLPPIALLSAPAADIAVVLLATAPADGLEEAVADIFVRDHLPAAAARVNPRVARRLLPSPELAEGWRARPTTLVASSTELAWRAALALAAIAMMRGQATVDQAAELIAAESGLHLDRARLQALAVAEQPLSALTAMAGRRAMGEGVAALGEQAVAGWLLEGALPGAVLRGLRR
ncbi:MAG: hypothetical protein ABR598_05585 [Candidatus Dormibacteria bacterium]